MAVIVEGWQDVDGAISDTTDGSFEFVSFDKNSFVEMASTLKNVIIKNF